MRSITRSLEPGRYGVFVAVGPPDARDQLAACTFVSLPAT
jgi:hypothetical protein